MTTEGAPAESGVAIERDVPFSKSLLWDLQRRYYAEKGPQAWHSGEVPSYATCNTFIAKSYVHMVHAYLRDARVAGMIDPKQPIYIVELAAGVGRFAFQFLTKLRQRLADSSLADLDIRYVMTDFTATNLEVWQKHPHLARFVSAGQLHFGKFDVDTDHAIELVGGSALSATTVKNPIVVLANYAFDTFRHDLFRIEGGKLHEVLLTTLAPDTSPDPKLPSLRIQYKPEPTRDDYYQDRVLDRVLAYYKQRLAEVTLGFPVGGFSALRSLLAISNNRMLLVSSDKGFTLEDELYNPHQHGMQLHGTSFSLMVNYHALGRYMTEHGGWYIPTVRRSLQLKTCALGIGGEPAQFADTRATIREMLEQFPPGEFFELLQNERQQRTPKPVVHFLNLLRLSGYDPGMLWDFAPQLREQAPSLPESTQLELRLAIDRAWQNYFPGPQNLPFELARIYMTLRRPLEAIKFGKLALEWFGDSPAAYLNLGICHYYSENPDEALRCFRRALEINRDWGLAREWIAKVEAEQAERVEVPSYSVPRELAAVPSGPIASVSGPVRTGT